MRTCLLASLIGTAITLAQPSGAAAAPITFAQFVSARVGNSYTFTSNGDGSGTFNSSGQINISFFDGGVPADRLRQPLSYTPQLANISRTSSTTGLTECVSSCVSGAPFVQGIADASVTIRRASDNALLLGISGDFAKLTGQIGGSAGNLETSDPPNNLVFTSDFIDFSSAVSLSRSISFSSATPFFSIASDGLLQSFTAAGSGTFAADFADVPVPEPVSMALLGMALLFLGVAHRCLR